MKLANLSPRLRRNLWIIAIAFALFTVTGFLILPPIVKSQLERRASAALGRTVTVDKVRLNPYTLALTLENLEVREKDGKGSFLGWNRLYVNFDALASLTGDWVLSEIELDGFHASVAVNHDGSLNFSDILARLPAAPAGPAAAPAKPSRPIRIGNLKVTQARVGFADQSRKKPFATVVGPLTFSLTEFRTAGARGAPYHFEAVTESGEKLAWTGTLSAEPIRSVGEFGLENIVLAKYAPYYADLVQADLVDGKLSVHGHYEIDLTEGQRMLKLQDGALQLRGIRLLERASQEPAVELPALDITRINADALAQKAAIGSIGLAGGHLHLRREKDGSINLLAMLQPAAENPAPVAPAAVPAAPLPGGGPGQTPASQQAGTVSRLPDVTIGEVALKDFQVDLTDLAAPRPAQLGLGGIQVSLKNVTLADGAAMPLQLALTWAPQGTVRMEGNVSIKPQVKADLKLDVAGLEIGPLSPYLEQFINARITQGSVTSNLTAQMALPAGQPPAATVTGGVKIEKFGLVDSVHNEDLAGLGSLSLTGLRISTAPQLAVALDEVNIAAPYARVIVNSDKTLNLAAVMKVAAAPAAGAVGGALRPDNPDAAAESGPKAPPASISAATPAPKIEIGRVVITEGDFSFADHSVEPNVRTAITQFGGTIAGLSSENMAKADVDLKATVDGAGPVAITGRLDPLGANKFVDLKIDFRNVDLLPLSPYSGKYAGYELARGKLVVDTKFLLDGKKIDATNVITLNQFTFGSPVQSPDATGLPVRLGVALLKDMDGRIVIDVPVQGSTDDPDFRIGRVVLRVIVNLLTKAAVSPFKLLGSMFGGGGDELAYQDFAPGAAVVQPDGIKKLETMVKALTNRPGLSLDLEGSYDGPADTYALRQQKLAGSVRRAIWEAKHAGDPTIAPPEQLVITPEENAAMVRKLFDEKYPPGTQFGAPLAKAPVAAPPPPAPKKGFFGRVVDVVTLKGLRSENARPAEAPKPAEAKPADAAVAGPSLDEMTGRLAETMAVDDNDLRALAAARAQQVRDYFINTGKIDPERLFLAKEKADPTKAGKGPRVFLTLQ
jgi:hypothetical protein